jgi:hypothetical protein
MASWPENVKVIRQLPFTRIDQCPTSSPEVQVGKQVRVPLAGQCSGRRQDLDVPPGVALDAVVAVGLTDGEEEVVVQATLVAASGGPPGAGLGRVNP